MKENDLLEKSILAAVVYYDGFGYPLPLWELRKNAVNLNRPSGGRLASEKISLFEILNLLEASELLKKTLAERDGFYFLKGREDIVEQRIERQKISDERWKKARRYAFLFRLVPFLKIAFVSGSLALNNAKRNSDVDLLLVSKSGRIWTCRFFALLFLAVFGVLRRGEKIAGRFCLNHFITDVSLEIKNQSLYNAQTYVNFVPFVVRDQNALEEFWKKNKWLGDYVLNFHPPRQGALNFHTAYAGDHSESSLPIIGSLIVFGNLAEKFFAFLQKRRIERDPRTFKAGGRVVADDSRLEFHPDSPEKEILEKYNLKMRESGFPELAEERNSGLLPPTPTSSANNF